MLDVIDIVINSGGEVVLNVIDIVINSSSEVVLVVKFSCYKVDEKFLVGRSGEAT